MATAYTPGLTVSARTRVRRVRRLPIKGDVLASLGQTVTPGDIVARALLPGIMQSVKVASALGIGLDEVEGTLSVKVGDTVEKDQLLAETKSFFGFFKSECRSPLSGTVEIFSHANGSLGIRQPPLPVEITAYLQGAITEILPGEGVVVETDAALVQGIFGVGGERTGLLRVVSPTSDATLDEGAITPDLAGMILIGGANITGAALRRASEFGVTGIIVGGIVDRDLIEFLGYDIGVAITGHENINLTLILTEGFGTIPMARRTFELLRSLEGQAASINGATQIRAGVIRPEVIVPRTSSPPDDAAPMPGIGSLEIGVSIRVIREPYFGVLGTVTALPSQLVTVESGASVRILQARLADGRDVTVPRANVEIIVE